MQGLISSVGRAVLCDYDQPPPTSPAAARFLERCAFLDSGTSALAISIRDAIARSDRTGAVEIILPAYCCPDILSAVRHNNARPVLVDFEPNTTWLSFSGIENALSDKTAAIIAVNFLGIHERLADIRNIIAGRNCYLIDDSCQAAPDLIGEQATADYRVFSFGRGKPISLLHGGAVQSRFGRLELGAHLKTLADDRFGRLLDRWRCRLFNSARNRVAFAGLYKLGIAGTTKYSAPGAILPMRRYPLEVLPSAIHGYWTQSIDVQRQIERGMKGKVLGDLLRSSSQLSDVNPVRLLRYPLLTGSSKNQNHLIAQLHKIGVCATNLYGNPLPDIRGTDLEVDSAEFPNAVDFSRKLITLPLHPVVTNGIVKNMMDVLSKKVK